MGAVSIADLALRVETLRDGKANPREIASAEAALIAEVKATPRPAGEPEVLNMEDIEEKDVRFLWRPYVPIGKVTLLEGDPGVGKTNILMRLAAAVSSGGTMPHEDGEGWVPMERGRVLLLCPEDDPEDTLKPRLDAAGANMANVDLLDGRRFTDAEGKPRIAPVLLAEHIDTIERAIEKARPALFGIDTLTTALGAEVDINRGNEVGAIMRDLKDLAERFGLAIVATRHLAKSALRGTVSAGLGSIAIAGTVRSVLQVYADPDRSSSRALFHVKSNCGPEGRPLGYLLGAGGFEWNGPAPFDLEKVRRGSTTERGPTSAALAETFVREALAGGPRKRGDLDQAAGEAGISKTALTHALSRLDCPSHQEHRVWWRCLPGQEPPEWRD